MPCAGPRASAVAVSCRPAPCEKIICLKNQNDLGLINGMFLTLEDIVDEGSLYFSAVVHMTRTASPSGRCSSRRHAAAGCASTRGTSRTIVAFDPHRHDRDWKDQAAALRGDLRLGHHLPQGARLAVGERHRLGRRPGPERGRPPPLALYRHHPRRARAGDPGLRCTRMIDLNDVWRPPAQFDLPEIRRRLAATAPGLAAGAVSAMRGMAADRKTLRCADLSGRAPRGEGSCVIHLEGPYAGIGLSIMRPANCRRPIDLIHHATGLSDRALFAEAARLARLDLPAPPRSPAAAHGPTTAWRSPAFSTAASRSPARPPKPICRAAASRIRGRRICCTMPT